MRLSLPAACLVAALLAGCASPPRGQPDRGGGGGLAVIDTRDVAIFRGTRMAEMLQRLEGDEPLDWTYVRKHVYPAPAKPGDWPPLQGEKPTRVQKEYRSYLYWPAHIRGLLQSANWDSLETRERLARYGRMYRLVFDFQNAPGGGSGTAEIERWRIFAERMLAYGDDGVAMLISNMLLALSNPDEQVVKRAQGILVYIDEIAIEPLLAMFWVLHRQQVQTDDGVKVVANPNFNKYVLQTLYMIGPRAVGPAIDELEAGKDNPKDRILRFEGHAWRFRKLFVELLGKLGDPRAIRAIGDEINYVKVTEYDREAMADGRTVIDYEATEYARFTYFEYCIQALGNLRHPDGLKPIIQIWATDDDHLEGAVDAIFRISARSVRDIDEARRVLAKYEKRKNRKNRKKEE